MAARGWRGENSSRGRNGVEGRGDLGAVLKRTVSVTLLWTSVVLVTGCLSPTAFVVESSTGELASTGEGSSSGSMDSDESAVPAVMTTTEDPDIADLAECSPGSRERCAYGGPAEALQVGSCRAAVRVCGEDGVWGACAGEVLPMVEDCRTLADEDCDGRSACSGEVVWVRSFGQADGGAPGHATVEALAIDGHERIWLTGGFSGSLEIGGRSWATSDTPTMFMGRLNVEGEPELLFADLQDGACGVGTVLAADRRGQVALGAVHCGKLRVAKEAPVRAALGGSQAAIVGVFAQSGDYVGDMPLRADGGDADIARLAYDGAGNLWIAGRFSGGPLRVGEGYDGMLVGAGGMSDGMVVKLGPDGKVVWAHGFGDEHGQEILDMDVDAAGQVWLVGGFVGSMQFAGGSLHAQAVDPNQRSMFVVKLDGDGAWQWGRAYGVASDQALSQVRVDADGEAVVAGYYRGPMLALGNEMLVNESSDLALVMARLDARGDLRWARSWGCYGACFFDSLVIDGAGQSVVSTSLEASSGLVIEEAVAFAAADRDGAVVAKLDRDGGLLWQPRLYAADVELAVGPTGAIYMAGRYDGEVSFGSAPGLQRSAGDDGEDVYVARARP